MSWTVQIGDGHPLEVSTPEAAMAAVAGVLMGSGVDARMAETFGRTAREAIQLNESQRRMNWSTKPLEWVHSLPNGDPVYVRATWLAVDPTKQCDGYTGSGNRCGRHMNHPGEC